MKRIIFIIAFVGCGLFVLVGFGTIFKGYIENTVEALILAGFLVFFLSIMFLIKRTNFGEKDLFLDH